MLSFLLTAISYLLHDVYDTSILQSPLLLADDVRHSIIVYNIDKGDNRFVLFSSLVFFSFLFAPSLTSLFSRFPLISHFPLLSLLSLPSSLASLFSHFPLLSLPSSLASLTSLFSLFPPLSLPSFPVRNKGMEEV